MSLYTPQQLLAIYVRDLLGQPEGSVVVLGRHNVDRNDLTSLRIAVDTDGPATRRNASRSYDGDAEQVQHAQQWSQPCVLNFYGDDAYGEAKRFMLITNGQRGYELQRDNGVAVFLASTVTDVKLLTGEDFSNRFELAVNVQYTESATEDVLRIDTAQFTIIED